MVLLWDPTGWRFLVSEVPWAPMAVLGAVSSERGTPVHTAHDLSRRPCHWSYWSFNEQSTSATPVGCLGLNVWMPRTSLHGGAYRGTSLTRKRPPPKDPGHRLTVGSLGGCVFLRARYPCTWRQPCRYQCGYFSQVQGCLAHKKQPPP